MSNNQFILAGNGPYKNHGCEALLRGTVDILRESYNNPRIIAATYCNEQIFNQQKQNEIDDKIEHVRMLFPIQRGRDWAKYKLTQMFNSNNVGNLRCKALDKYIDDATAVLAIGGDNYTIDYNTLNWYTDIDNYVIRHNKPLILWGASIGPFTKDLSCENYMKKHLKEVTGIFAREPETIEYLDRIGIKDNVYRVSDPAFILKSIKPYKMEMNIKQGSIGINLSPLMINYLNDINEDEFINTSSQIIEKIAQQLNKHIYLIPHVVTQGGSDFTIMEKVYSAIDRKYKDRIELIDDTFTASEYKWIISQMEVFFGARTHATIAALSTLVPTLSFVYSIKSVGINKDLFGSDEYCIYPKQYNGDYLVERIKNLIDNKVKIRRDLQIRVDESKKLALKAGEYLKKIIG